MSHHSVKLAARGRVVLLGLLAVLVAVAVAAAPAAAATPTTLTLKAQHTTVSWGATAILNGVLQTDGGAPCRWTSSGAVRVRRVDDHAGPVDSRPTELSPTLRLSTRTAPVHALLQGDAQTLLAMIFTGTAEWDAQAQHVVYVKVKPVIGKPSCPSAVKHGKRFTVSGSLKTQYGSGSKNVKIRAQRYSSGQWKAYKTYTATTTDSGSYSKYSLRFSISRTGKYRFYATIAKTRTLAAGKSAYSRSMQVK